MAAACHRPAGAGRAGRDCANIRRLDPPPLPVTQSLSILGIPNARFWLDARDRAAAARGRADDRAPGAPSPARAAACRRRNFLALSGGGDNGAFGAGLLVGWTASGRRPAFDLVTGISAGALIAPFAFLGPDYDPQLREVFTEVAPHDLITLRRPDRAPMLFGEALADTSPLYAPDRAACERRDDGRHRHRIRPRGGCC